MSEKQGFASMNKERVQEIAKKGGEARKEQILYDAGCQNADDQTIKRIIHEGYSKVGELSAGDPANLSKNMYK